MKNLVFLINHNEEIKLKDLLAKLAASNTRNQIKVYNKLFNEFQDTTHDDISHLILIF